MIPSLDEQLKATMAEHGADIQRGAEAELEAELHREEKQKQESELAESIAEEANAEVNARHGVSTFFRRFLPNWV
jgi:hypothetical protein